MDTIFLTQIVNKGLKDSNIEFVAHDLQLASVVNKTLHLSFILCPLFNPGPVKESRLMSTRITVSDSRVSNKWEVFSRFITQLSKDLKQNDVAVDITFLFADNGVPVNKIAQINITLLGKHKKVWENGILDLQRKANFEFKLLTFSELVPQIPRQIDFKVCPESLSSNLTNTEINRQCHIINEVNNIRDQWFRSSSGKISKLNCDRKTKKTVKRLIKVFGVENTFWFLATYTAFDWKIRDIFDKGIAVKAERFEALHFISKLTPSLNRVARIDLKA